MPKLFCAVVGARGSVFPVDIDESQSVGDLKKTIKKEKMYQFPADDLQLFLAKTEGGAWLPDEHDAALELYEGKIHADINTMIHGEQILPTKTVAFWLKKNQMLPPSTEQIHVLVRVPDYASGSEVTQSRKLTPLGKLLKDSKSPGELPQKGDFLRLFKLTDADCGKILNTKEINDIAGFVGTELYIRKEILCVLENFKKTYQQEFDGGEGISQQFILMGTPGTGKSCILALISFYIAVVYDRPVVWHRQVGAGFGVETTTRLFYQGKYYEWDDVGVNKYAGLYDVLQASGANVKTCWFCIDGMSQSQIVQKSLFNRFRLLATSGQFSVKAEASEYSKLCLVPYWRQEDLEDFGKHKGMSESAVAARFFESGGSLRDFLQLNFTHMKKALDAIQSSGHAENLLTDVGLSGEKQIDRIRMRGVQDRNNADHYMDNFKWTSCVTSPAVLNSIAHLLKPNFFEKLKDVAKGMNDKRLEGVAFEGYFHALVRHHHQPIRVEFRRYDNVNHRDYPNWKNIMGEPDVIECSQLSLSKIKVSTAGKNMEECVAEMEEWAANPSKMDYWTPATSLCETIDAVAKWTLPDDGEHFCLLQLTMATKHTCDEEVLWKLAQPFVAKKLKVCYIALLRDEAKIFQFRLDPVQIKKREISDNVPLYVAHFEEVDVSHFIARGNQLQETPERLGAAL